MKDISNSCITESNVNEVFERLILEAPESYHGCPADEAYDGQKVPQRRELVALERETICRVINDLWTAKRHHDPRVEMIRMSGDTDWLMLLAIRAILTPRED